MPTEATLTHHLRAFAHGPDTIMRDYTDDSVLISPDGVLRGIAEIRFFFERFLADSPPALLAALTVVRQEIQGESAYILWKAEPFIPFATTRLSFATTRFSRRRSRHSCPLRQRRKQVRPNRSA